MPRQKRQASPTDTYHVSSRGAGRMCIFEEEQDYQKFLDYMVSFASKCDIEIWAWVLMSNHYHILVKGDLDNLTSFLRRIGTAYAQFFNGKYDHVGHVFQGRPDSVAIMGDAQLYATVRYIHLNPLKAGISEVDNYKWSSYREFVEQEFYIEPGIPKQLFPKKKDFIKFHEASTPDEIIYFDYRERLADADAIDLVKKRYGKDFLRKIITLDAECRRENLCTLYRAGLSQNQISRLTGIGRNIVQRTLKNYFEGDIEKYSFERNV